MTRRRITFLPFLVALTTLLAASLPAASPIARAQQGAPCSFTLGFATMHDLIPDIVGDCAGDPTPQPNGDVQQQTTNGLLVWRKADNWTAFTDGTTTWVNGPNGLESRGNDERFAWEPPLTSSEQPATAPASGPAQTTDTGGHYGVLFSPSPRQDSIAGLATAVNAGVPWVRLQITQAQAHPGPGSFNWAKFDQMLDQFQNHNVKVLAVLGYSTPWDTTAPANTPPGQRNKYFPPDNLTYWREYVHAVASHYQGRIAAYEVWNEPDPGGPGDADTGAASGPGRSPAEFAALVAATAAEIHAADPAALVVGSGFHGHPLATGNSPWFQQFWSDTAHPPSASLDVVSFHLIRPTQPHQETLDDATAAIGALRAAGVTQPIWITEVGYSSNPRFQQDPYTGPDGQARWLTDTLPALLQAGADKVFWALLQDQSGSYTPNGPYGANGLLDSTAQPKPAWDAFLKLIQGG